MKTLGLLAAAVAVLLTATMTVVALFVAVILPPGLQACAPDQDATAATFTGHWRQPLVSSYTTTSAFGTRFHPVLRTTKLHTGIDLVTGAGDTSIVAAAGGTVAESGFNNAYGHQVVIDHGSGLRSRYAHMASYPRVSQGQKVSAGTELGAQGATGLVTGPHLHFEIIKNGAPIDPKPFMASQGAPLNGTKPQQRNEEVASASVGADPTVAPSSPKKPATKVSARRADGQTFTVSGDQLDNAVVIAQVGHESGVGDRGVIIALVTALQESTLRNINYGDRDSLGLFQQRPSTGWGTPAEVRNPVKAAEAFFGVAAHTSNPGLKQIRGWKQMSPNDAAQAVQRSGFPREYAKWEPVARALTSAIGGGTVTLEATCDESESSDRSDDDAA